MLDKIKNFFKKTPKGFVALPIAVAAVALVTVLALPFFGNNASSDSGNKGPVISFGDKENNNNDEDDNDSNGSGDLVGDNGSSENGDSNNSGSTENDGNAGSTDNNDDENNDQTGNEDAGNSGSGSTGGNEGTTSNPSGSTDKNPDDPDDENNSDNNSGSTGDNNGGNSGNTGDNDGGNSGNNSGNTGDSNSGNSGGNNDGNTGNNGGTIDGNGSTSLEVPGVDLSEIPAYSDKYSITLNNGVPYFSTSNLSTNAFEYYSNLDALGRCGVAYACLGPELLPTEERGDIGSVTPSGWIQAQYDIVPGRALWNRSHLIAFSLAGENANKLNLITGTQHMNQIEMQVYETQVLNYIKETGNHVIYRVTPMYDGNNLVATGVQMEAWSIEDEGETICFNVFIYNVQDGIIIDYATGNSSLDPNYTPEDGTSTEVPEWANFVVNTNSGKIHKITCSGLPSLQNRAYFATYAEALAYVELNFPNQSKPDCGTCKPKP